MVQFILVDDNSDCATYEYYPEGKKDDGYGILTLFKDDGHVDITKLASMDSSEYASVEELLETREFMSRMRQEEGGDPLTEEEWPTPTMGFTTTLYADPAISKIIHAYEKGEILKEGTAIWY